MDIILLYLFTRLEAVSFTVGFFFTAGIVFVMVGWLIRGVTENSKLLPGEMRFAYWVIAISLAANLIIPTQKQAAIILAGSAIIDVAKSETAGRLASKSVQLIEQTIDGYLKEKVK
jgi:hypothetical protein